MVKAEGSTHQNQFIDASIFFIQFPSLSNWSKATTKLAIGDKA